jgi:predicted phosphodiesterase
LAANSEQNTQPYTITNPYENVDWTTYGQYKADFHAHSLNSDGADKTVDMVEDHYAKGFDILAMTDHSYLTRAWFLADLDPLTASREVEINAGVDRGGKGMIDIFDTNEQSATDHINSFFANYNDDWVDSGMADTIEKVEKLGGITHINHPGRYTGGASGNVEASNNPANVKKYVDLYMAYPSCVGIEIINKIDNESRCDRILWDNILMQTMAEGRSVWGFSNDDSHSLDATGYSWNVMLIPALTPYETRIAMESGAFYAISRVSRPDGINATLPGGGAMPGSGDKSTLYLLEQKIPSISNIVVDEETAVITISGADYDVIEWIADGEVIATGNSINISNYADKINSYVRAQLKSATGIAFTQPFGVKDTSFVAETLTLTPGSSEQDMNFTWYSAREDNTASVVQIAKKSAQSGIEFPTAGVIVAEGTTGNAAADKSWHKASITGLDLDTTYIYRVSNDKNIFSEIYEFKTAAAGGFQFIAIGDSQLTTGNQDNESIWPWPVTTTRAGWANTVTAFTTRFPNAGFIMSCGDQVDTSGGNETEYANLFEPAELRSMPLAPAMGNHDRHNNFDWHYNLPNETPNGAGATISGVDVFGNYWYSYSNALFVVLNTSASPNDSTVGAYIAQFDVTLDAATKSNPNTTWLFVQHHKSTAAPASHQTDVDVRVWTSAFNALMDKYQVDFVLAGHDHVYSRSWFIKDGKKVENIDYGINSVTNPQGTLYFTLNTSSGLKYYDFPNDNTSGSPAWVYDINDMYYEGRNNITFTGKPWYTNKAVQVKVPQFSTVDVSEDSVIFKTYRVDTMAVLDEYTVKKQATRIENISLQIGAYETLRNFVWYSNATDPGKVQVAQKSAMNGSEFPAAYKQFNATSSTAGVPQGLSSFKATVTGLAANTEYVYRVGDDSAWSAIYSFKTQVYDDSFSFFAAGDPQIGARNLTNDITAWVTTLEKSIEAFPEVSFLITLGDQVASEFSDAHYNGLFTPETLKSIPLAAVAGNHDVPSPLFAPHFNMPNMSDLGCTSPGSGDGDYWYVYNNTLFMSLNLVNTNVEEHEQFMLETIAAHPNVSWKVVTVHFTLLFEQATNSGYWPITRPLREKLVPILSELGIDLVLAGHDHSYVRTFMMDGLTPVIPADGVLSSVTNPPAEQVLYLNLNSSTGSIYVNLSNTEASFTAVKNQENVPNISKIDITDASLNITTYRTTDMTVVDTFTIYKSSEPNPGITVNFPGIKEAAVQYYTNVAGWVTVGVFSDSCKFVIPANHKATWGATTVRVVKDGMYQTFTLDSLDKPVVLDAPIETITVVGIDTACDLAIVQNDWVYGYAPVSQGIPNEFKVFSNGKKYEVRLYRPGFYPISVPGIDAGQTVNIGASYIYEVEVPTGVTNVWISSYDWAVRGASAGDKIVLFRDGFGTIREAKMRYDYDGKTNNVEFKLDGSNPFKGLNP